MNILNPIILLLGETGILVYFRFGISVIGTKVGASSLRALLESGGFLFFAIGGGLGFFEGVRWSLASLTIPVGILDGFLKTLPTYLYTVKKIKTV